MSGLVRNPEDRFSRDPAYISLDARKGVFLISDLVRLRKVCSVSKRLEILDLNLGVLYLILCRENKSVVLRLIT